MILTLLLFLVCLSSDPSICSAEVFCPLRNSDHVVASTPIDFPLNLKGMLLFILQLSIILVLTGIVSAII